MRRVVAGYFPVLHAGYLEFLEQSAPDEVLVLSDDLMALFDWKRKDIRALPAVVMVRVLRSVLAPGVLVRTCNIQELRRAAVIDRLIMPDDEVTRTIASSAGISERVELLSAFLRWNSRKLTSPKALKTPEVSAHDLPDSLAWQKAVAEALRSSDWWRQVGAAVSLDGKILVLAHNQHMPHELMPYVYGDPRMFAKKGVAIEISTALHAEAAVIAGAASRGIALQLADLYVTTFPCPPCAKLIAAVGFRRLFFKEGYGILDAEAILRSAGVEMFRIVE